MSRLYIYHSVKMRIEFLHVVQPYMYFYWFEQIGSKLFFFPGFEFITWKILINIKYILNIIFKKLLFFLYYNLLIHSEIYIKIRSNIYKIKLYKKYLNIQIFVIRVIKVNWTKLFFSNFEFI